MFVSMALKGRVFRLDSPPRDCINKGMLDFLSDEKTMRCTKLLLERAVYCQEQDGETIRRAAHRLRAQAWTSSQPSAPCPADREEHHLVRLPFGGWLTALYSTSQQLAPRWRYVDASILIATLNYPLTRGTAGFRPSHPH